MFCRHLGAALCLAALLAASTAHSQLLAHWKGDGNALDSAGTHHGTALSGVTYAPGRYGDAFLFDGGLSGYINVPDSPDWALGTGDFTFALWANFRSVNAGGAGSLPNVFFGHDNGGGSVNKWIYYMGGDSASYLHVNSPGGGDFLGIITGAPAIGVWDHYALTRSGTIFTFYRNGAAIGSLSSAVPLPDASTSLTIGQAEGLGFFNGMLDDIRIYRNALTGSQIRELYSPTPAPPGNGVPEPGTFALLIAAGAGGRLLLRRR